MVLAILAGVAVLPIAPRAWACEAPVHLGFEAPVALDGVLKSGTGHHEVQGDFTFRYLALDQGICVHGSGDTPGPEAPVDRIQLAGEGITTKLPMGTRVHVQGSLFPAHTMWHVEPVLIDAGSIEVKK